MTTFDEYTIFILTNNNTNLILITKNILYLRRLECLSQFVFELSLVVDGKYSYDWNADSLVSANILSINMQIII